MTELKEVARPIAPGRWTVTVTAAGVAAAIGAMCAIVLRVALVFRYRIDSDETQHLHVVWAWTHGLMQYRDAFDNHMPLFHVLAIPLLRMAGERPEALIAGRLAMLPLVALIALLTYRVVAALYGQRAAVWTTLIAVCAPDFFLCSVEFRPDVLWAACWMASLAILVCLPATPRNAAFAGLMLGLAAAVSAKTTLMVATLVVAGIVTSLLLRATPSPRRALIFAIVAAVPPAAIAAWFAMQGAWEPFVRGTIGHNLVSHEHPHRVLLLLPSAALIALGVRRVLRDGASPELRQRRLFLLLAGCVYGAMLVSLWPIIQREHFLPFYPAAVAGVVPLFLQSARWPRFAAVLLAVELLWSAGDAAVWRDDVLPTTTLIRQATTLTAPGEKVVDLKGDVVFRERVPYYVLEKITKKAIREGRLPDTIAADVLRTRTMVALRDNPGFPREGRAFLQRNFIDAGCLRVAGMMVPPSHVFRIELPAQYSVVSPEGAFEGMLDGSRYTGPRFLSAGMHRLSPTSRTPQAIIWTRAATHGFSPFVRDGRCPVVSMD